MSMINSHCEAKSRKSSSRELLRLFAVTARLKIPKLATTGMLSPGMAVILSAQSNRVLPVRALQVYALDCAAMACSRGSNNVMMETEIAVMDVLNHAELNSNGV